jgi:hypothetical protein
MLKHPILRITPPSQEFNATWIQREVVDVVTMTEGYLCSVHDKVSRNPLNALSEVTPFESVLGRAHYCKFIHTGHHLANSTWNPHLDMMWNLSWCRFRLTGNDIPQFLGKPTVLSISTASFQPNKSFENRTPLCHNAHPSCFYSRTVGKADSDPEFRSDPKFRSDLILSSAPSTVSVQCTWPYDLRGP